VSINLFVYISVAFYAVGSTKKNVTGVFCWYGQTYNLFYMRLKYAAIHELQQTCFTKNLHVT